VLCLNREIDLFLFRLREKRSLLVSSGVASLDQLLGDGYPDRSTVLITGPPGIGKQALGYWFTHSGLVRGDVGLYVTRFAVHEVLQDIRAFGIDNPQMGPIWFASDSRGAKYDANDLAGLESNILDILRKNRGRRTRITIDILSSLLVLNAPETVYKFLAQLFSEMKRHDVVLLATLEDGMHKPEVLVAMQELFDGVVELRMYEDRLRLLPLLRITKMRGMTPSQAYFNVSFSKTGIEVSAYAKELGIRGWLRGPK
jgi:circadian clock protein KaiC